MAQIGSNLGITAQNLSQTIDSQGNPIISSETDFGSSPAGSALLTQQLFGLANATFNLTPPDPYSPITPDNTVPYWDFIEYSSGEMSGSATYSSTTGTWGIDIRPGTAVINDYCVFRTRSYLVNDDNLALRQKALAVVSKGGTAGGTAASWQLVLSATYYDATDAQISTYAIGTVTDVGSWTSISGTTTSGGSAIGASARYVDLSFTMTALGTVTGSAYATIKSCLLQSSSGGGGGAQSFIVTETFTTSGSWIVPTGVTTLVAVYGIGAGGGGASGAYLADGVVASNNQLISGSGGGGGGVYGVIRDLPVSGTVTIGIGAGGSGGTAATFSKAAGGTARVFGVGGTASRGGDTTFGSLVTFTGGGRGGAGSARFDASGNMATGGSGGGAGAATSTYYGIQIASTTGGGGAGASTSTTAQSGGAAEDGQGSFIFTPFTSGTIVAGGSASSTGTAITATNGSPSNIGTAFFPSLGGGGGGGGALRASLTPPLGSGSNMNGNISAGAGAGGGIFINITGGGAGTVGAQAGNGGSAPDGYGGGGGAGGVVGVQASSTANWNARAIAGTAGAGGDGGDGKIAIAYIA